MKKLNSQSGRSMIEMLGVLAIIGVLSVGGIAGYSLSMRRHRANGVADIATKYALVVYGYCQQKLMDGEITALGYCSTLSKPQFNDAGVGSLPAGVNAVRVQGTITDETTGTDKVTVEVSFSDPKLCQAAGSISGLGCKSGGTIVNFEINQN